MWYSCFVWQQLFFTFEQCPQSHCKHWYVEHVNRLLHSTWLRGDCTLPGFSHPCDYINHMCVYQCMCVIEREGTADCEFSGHVTIWFPVQISSNLSHWPFSLLKQLQWWHLFSIDLERLIKGLSFVWNSVQICCVNNSTCVLREKSKRVKSGKCCHFGVSGTTTTNDLWSLSSNLSLAVSWAEQGATLMCCTTQEPLTLSNS